jgi:uncharacterized damage-inducible protein DinB
MRLTELAIAPPEPAEFDPYFDRYISLVAGNDILRILEEEMTETAALLSTIAEDRADYRYQPEKWSIKEMLGHVIDTERIFAYRALRIARNDPKPLEGFEQDDYVRFSPLGNCSLRDLIAEFQCVRHSTLFLLRKLDAESWMRRGEANGKLVSVRALAYLTAGHSVHHRNVLNQKYLASAASQ